MNRLNIFWIEDNPKLEKLKMVNKIKFPSFDLDFSNEGDQLFSFKLFQHPAEVKEFLLMLHKLNEKGLLPELGAKCCSAIPDIVVFDYKLSDNFSTNNPKALRYHGAELEFLVNHSASWDLKSAFESEFLNSVLFFERTDVQEGNYSSDELRDELGATGLISTNDEFGLYAGIAVIREFKDSITVGVPATFNKAEKTQMSDNSLFYEWLNSYDIENTIQRKKRGSKGWTDILQFSLPLLRNRIISQVACGKIIPNYDQLNRFSNRGSEPDYLSFHSLYGERQLPIRGLFIYSGNEGEDMNSEIAVLSSSEISIQKTDADPIASPEIEGLNESVQDFVGRIMGALRYRDIDISSAIEASNRLWDIYTAEFGRRLRLSELHRIKRVTTDPLDSDEQKKYDSLFAEFFPQEDVLEEASVIEYLGAGEKGQNFAVRLAVLALAAKAEIALNQSKEYNESREIYQSLSRHEFLNIFFPRVRYKNDSVELPIHLEKTKRNEYEESFVKSLNERIFGERLNNSRWFGFNWAESAELRLLRSKLYPEISFWPEWLQ